MTKKEEDLTEYFLQPEMMLRLYRSGAFPMAESKESTKVEWYMPEIRAIIPLDNFNIPRSFKKFLRESTFTIHFDRDFPAVVEGCASREETWISSRLTEAYMRLHRRGYIHTVEVYDGEDKIAGGLYGIAIGGVFFGESMFSYKPQSSKTALYHLMIRLREKEFAMLDVQIMNEHLRMFGAVEIPDYQYKEMLAMGLEKKCRF
ncbi:MAG: Leucyl/phenylalanyl-tRNA--protein transferase [Ignavibacteriaceae bacterium]|nr:Leucyl/phenylalanyl-tRNA--protein transferase [Ignavibacteriaceae bacterium]